METPLPAKCGRCDCDLQEGFLVDHSYAMTLQQRWVPGEPKNKLLGIGGVKVEDAFLVATWRCPQCGKLESFATRRVD